MPIDAHRRTILAHIGAHRVTIIQDETGCGKSSRLPQMLLDYGGSEGQMMVAQPRRLAAHSLLQRARQSLPPERRHLVRMRMGHGVRDEESGTRLWYVITGAGQSGQLLLIRMSLHADRSSSDGPQQRSVQVREKKEVTSCAHSAHRL